MLVKATHARLGTVWLKLYCKRPATICARFRAACLELRCKPRPVVTFARLRATEWELQCEMRLAAAVWGLWVFGESLVLAKTSHFLCGGNGAAGRGFGWASRLGAAGSQGDTRAGRMVLAKLMGSEVGELNKGTMAPTNASGP